MKSLKRAARRQIEPYKTPSENTAERNRFSDCVDTNVEEVVRDSKSRRGRSDMCPFERHQKFWNSRVVIVKRFYIKSCLTPKLSPTMFTGIDFHLSECSGFNTAQPAAFVALLPQKTILTAATETCSKNLQTICCDTCH